MLMAAAAAQLSLSPQLFVALYALCIFVAQTALYAFEAAWLSLARPAVHRAQDARPASIGPPLWLAASQQLWLALFAARWFFSSTLAIALLLQTVPHMAAWTGLRGPVLWLPLLLLSLFVSLVSRTLGQVWGRRRAVEVGPRGMALLAPLAYLLAPLTYILDRLPHDDAGSPGEGPFWTADAIAHMVRHMHQEHLGERSLDLFASVSEFSDTVIREIMVPRPDMVSIASTASHSEICAQVLEAGHSRMPVYEDTIDHIVGVLHVKDLFAAQLREHETNTPFTLEALLRPCFYVPEIMQISLLLREFQRRKTHLAIVVDEYGGTAGVVTLEDIIEEIVGEIQDEYDVEEKQFRVLSESKVLADARVNLWDLEQALGVSFPSDGKYETLAGFLMAISGHLPQRGAQITWQNLRFTIKEGNERRVGMVDIERLTRVVPL